MEENGGNWIHCKNSGIVTEIVTEDENSVVLDQGLIVITVEGELSAKSILVIPGILKSQEKK